MVSSVKLAHLLRLIWGSPIFGDAFPADISTRTESVLSQIRSVNTPFVVGMSSLLTQAMPQVASAAVDKLVQSIGLKILPFCSAIVAGDLCDPQQLQSVAMNISLIYWADQSMDGGDEPMLAAVQLLGNGVEPQPAEAPPAMVASRLIALRAIEQEVRKRCLAEDVEALLHCGIQETLSQESKKRQLSRLYGLQGGSEFWAVHTQDMADNLLATAALVNIAATLYAMIYRQHHSELPDLPEIFKEQRIMEVLHGPYNAAIRVFDDLSDRSRDRSRYPGWGEFNLNIFNQSQSELLSAFLHRAGLTDEALIRSVREAFQSGTEDGRAYIVQVFVDLIRDRLMALHASLWNRYGVFLTLAKRVMEASYVYAYSYAMEDR